MDDIERRNIIARTRSFIRAINCMYWLLNGSAVVNQAAFEFLPAHEATRLSWDEPAKQRLWAEALAPFCKEESHEPAQHA